MTRKDYKVIARVFAYQISRYSDPIDADIVEALSETAERMSRELLAASKFNANGNKSFKVDVFLKACGAEV